MYHFIFQLQLHIIKIDKGTVRRKFYLRSKTRVRPVSNKCLDEQCTITMVCAYLDRFFLSLRTIKSTDCDSALKKIQPECLRLPTLWIQVIDCYQQINQVSTLDPVPEPSSGFSVLKILEATATFQFLKLKIRIWLQRPHELKSLKLSSETARVLAFFRGSAVSSRIHSFGVRIFSRLEFVIFSFSLKYHSINFT